MQIVLIVVFMSFLYAFYPNPTKNDNMKYLCIGLSSFLLI